MGVMWCSGIKKRSRGGIEPLCLAASTRFEVLAAHQSISPKHSSLPLPAFIKNYALNTPQIIRMTLSDGPTPDEGSIIARSAFLRCRSRRLGRLLPLFSFTARAVSFGWSGGRSSVPRSCLFWGSAPLCWVVVGRWAEGQVFRVRRARLLNSPFFLSFPAWVSAQISRSSNTSAFPLRSCHWGGYLYWFPSWWECRSWDCWHSWKKLASLWPP